MNMEVAQRPIFGEITLQDMQGNKLLTKTVMPLVAEVCKHSKGRYDAASIADGLVSGTYKLWGVMRPPANLDAVTVTRVDGKSFELILLGPDFDEVFMFLPALKGAARAAGCDRVRMSGPQFWKKALPEGWRSAAVVYEAVL